MGHLSAVSTGQIEEGFDAIARAAVVADVVASVAMRGRGGEPGVGILSNYANTAATETALRVATAMGFRAHRVSVDSPLGRAIADPAQDDEMAADFHAELDMPGATFHVIEAAETIDAPQRIARLVSAIATRRPPDARTSIVVTIRGDFVSIASAMGRALRMDPDDIVVRMF